MKHAGPELLRDVERWLEEYCGNWALVDNLATSVLSPLLRRYPELMSEVKKWTSSPNPWLRRGAPGGSGCWRPPGLSPKNEPKMM